MSGDYGLPPATERDIQINALLWRTHALQGWVWFTSFLGTLVLLSVGALWIGADWTIWMVDGGADVIVLAIFVVAGIVSILVMIIFGDVYYPKRSEAIWATYYKAKDAERAIKTSD